VTGKSYNTSKKLFVGRAPPVSTSPDRLPAYNNTRRPDITGSTWALTFQAYAYLS